MDWTLRDAEIARQLGCCLSAVSYARKRGEDGLRIWVWTAAKDRLLGTMSDRDLAARWGIDRLSIFRRRTKLGIPPHPR